MRCSGCRYHKYVSGRGYVCTIDRLRASSIWICNKPAYLMFDLQKTIGLNLGIKMKRGEDDE